MGELSQRFGDTMVSICKGISLKIETIVSPKRLDNSLTQVGDILEAVLETSTCRIFVNLFNVNTFHQVPSPTLCYFLPSFKNIYRWGTHNSIHIFADMWPSEKILSQSYSGYMLQKHCTWQSIGIMCQFVADETSQKFKF
jgi:hypothetical protein